MGSCATGHPSWLGRALALGCTAMIVACASIAGLEEAGSPATETSTTPPSTQGSTSSGSAGTPGTSGGTSSGGPDNEGGPNPTVDSGPDAPACGLNGQRCERPEQCCSGKCKEDRSCDETCRPLGDPCFVAASNECCIGSFCSNNFGCKTCIEAGEEAERVAGIHNPKSCCSREMVPVLGNCR